jgi:hypothetical protein
MPGFHAGHAPGNKGLGYPADPPKVEEIVAVMRAAGDRGASDYVCAAVPRADNRGGGSRATERLKTSHVARSATVQRALTQRPARR